MIGNENLTYRERTRSFRFPKVGYYSLFVLVNGYRLCRHPSCSVCSVSPEVVVVHYDCFQIFSSHFAGAGEPDRRLWTIGSHRNPWPRAPHLHLLLQRPDNVDAFCAIAAISRLELLKRLPQELLNAIWQQEPHSMFWRAISVLSLGPRLALPSAPPQMPLLSSLDHWERGQLPSTVIGPRCLVVRFTIDLDGIQKIERLPTRGRYQSHGNRNVAYIVEDETALLNIRLHLQVCVNSLSLNQKLNWNRMAS